METQIGRVETPAKHSARRHPSGVMKVTLHAFPDIGLIVKAPTGVIYSNQTGGFACLHPEAEGFFVPLRTPFGMRELYALQSICPTGFDADEGLSEAAADKLDWILSRQGLQCIRADRSRLGESWEAWVHVTVSGEMGYKVPLECPRPERLEAILTWLNSD